MKELGEHLKETRIKHGVSLEEAASDLNVSTDLLENLESANTKAFKDVYDIKKIIKEYAKYLGLDEVKVQDEFNDFLFEHTSKISLDDILTAQKKLDDNEKKVQSPYTKDYSRKFGILPIISLLLLFVLLISVVYLIISIVNKAPARKDELMPMVREEIRYEFAY